MRTKNLALLLFLIILSPITARADCLACWELRKVEIILKVGETRTGFILWNEAWLNDKVNNWKQLKDRFPESVLEYYRSLPSDREILVLTKLATVSNDSLAEFKAVMIGDQLKIPVDEILKIVEIDKDLDRYQGAGSIPIYTQAELEMLNTNPYATYQEQGIVSDTYFLSYSKQIKRQQLKEISESDYRERKEALAESGVIIVTIEWD